MFPNHLALVSKMVTRLLFGVGCVLASNALALGQEQVVSAEIQAAGVLGTSESAVLSMIRELTSWKERALRAEALLAKAGVAGAYSSSQKTPLTSGAGASVVGTLEAERMLILSLGRDNGAMLGALVSVGRGVVAKVVESRETVSAALVDNSYKGKLATLEGLPVQLAVR